MVTVRTSRFSGSPDELIKKATSSLQRREAVCRLVARLRARAAAKGAVVGVLQRPYNPVVFAELLGVTRVRAAEKIDVAGRIVFHGGNTVIEFNRDRAAQQRFAIAHEVAHLALWETERMLVPEAKPRRARSQGVEQLCNEIAAELLAPRKEVLDEWKVACSRAFSNAHNPDPTAMIIKLAESFNISVYSAALRFAEICRPRSGAALLNLEQRSFVWSFRVPEISGLLHFLLSQREFWQSARAGKSETARFFGSTTYRGLTHSCTEQAVTLVWRSFDEQPNFCLAVALR